MELLEHYTSAVSSFLPPAQQDDIVKELSANLQAEMDDRAAELGRPLSAAEQEAILQQHGHPMIVAARYQPNQIGLAFGRQLIGPALFPVYLRVLWFTMGVSLAIYLLVRIALAISGNPITFAETLNAALLQIALQFAIVTGIFTVANSSLSAMQWNAQRPPTLPPMFRYEQLRPYMESIAELAAIIACAVGVWLLFTKPSLFFGAAANQYQPAPVWQQVLLAVIPIVVVNLAQAVMTLVRPAWARFHPLVRMLSDVALLGILIYLLQADHLVMLASSGSNGGNALETVNGYVYYGLLSFAVGVAIVMVFDAWKLLRSARRQPANS